MAGRSMVGSVSGRAGWNLFLLLLLGNSEIGLEGFLYIFREAWHSFRCKVVDSFRMKTHKRGGIPTWAYEDLLPIGEKTAVKEELDAFIAGFLFGAFEGIGKLLGTTVAFRVRPRGCWFCPAIPHGPAHLAFLSDVTNTVSEQVSLAPVMQN